jgi:uncharacterized sodium:solute symporter family permease YidK
MINLHEIKDVFMTNRLFAPFIAGLLFLVIDLAILIEGINNHEGWRITTAVIVFIIAVVLLFLIFKNNRRELKPVRVRAKR